MAELQLDGQSNFGFQPDDWNCDTVSRYTATTEIADDNKENKDKNEQSNGGAKNKTKTEKEKKKKSDKENEKKVDEEKEENKTQKGLDF